MRLLVTGAAGVVGRCIAPALTEHELLLTDLPGKGFEPLDVTDRDAVREAVGWCDTVIHLQVGKLLVAPYLGRGEAGLRD